MKQISMVTSFLCGSICTSLSQPSWQFVGGPWYASLPRDISIGYRGSSPVMFVADSTENSLLKTTDEGETWTHLGVAIPFCVAAIQNNPDVVYVGSLSLPQNHALLKSTNEGGGLGERFQRACQTQQGWDFTPQFGHCLCRTPLGC